MDNQRCIVDPNHITNTIMDYQHHSNEHCILTKGLWEDVAEHIGNLNRVKIIKESYKTFKSVIHVLIETSVIFS